MASRRARVGFWLAGIALLLSAACSASGQSRPRNPRWAAAVAATHIENLYQIDTGVYRCGQPDKKGFAELQRMGVREVLNLRNLHSDDDEAENTSLALRRVEMRAADPQCGKVVEALRIIKDREGPIAIHCWHGSDRTGLVAAMYRIVFQGWSKDDAIDELANGEYGYHKVYGDILVFIRDADVEAIRRQVLAE